MEIQTHQAINTALCGHAVALAPGGANVLMSPTPEMAADATGLVHGGFVFGMAGHAAMVAVNHPNVVLGSAETRFLKPVTVGDVLQAVAEVREDAGRKRSVTVTVTRDGGEVMTSVFACFVPDAHVLP